MSILDANRASIGAETLFGLDLTEGLVAIETDGAEGMLLYRRTPEGVRPERAPFKPWILLTEQPADALPGATYTQLDGQGYCVLAEFDSPAVYRAARFEVQDRHLAHLTYPAGAKMAFIRS